MDAWVDPHPDTRVGRAGALVVEFCDEEFRVVDRLTVGRVADLEVDTNPYLHRVVAEFRHDGVRWWLRNVGSRLVVRVRSEPDGSTSVVAPGSAVALVSPAFTVRFTAGPATYELHGVVELLERELDLRTGGETSGQHTLEWGRVELNAEQRLLLLALCEPLLTDPDDGRLPAHRVAARRLGWTFTKYHRKLDNLCLKVARAGVTGLHGDIAGFATERRQVLAELAIANRWVTLADLADLDGPTADDGRGAVT